MPRSPSPSSGSASSSGAASSGSAGTPWPGPVLARFRRDLLKWYGQRARDLPWRKSGDPYRIWISEVMLQQTTVVAVVPYFERFIARFPTVRELAAAPLDDVLRLWEGLGYYSRARNLHRAAQQLVLDHDAVFPQTVEGLMSLPGIGRYTAGAILSFAFDIPAPIVEANTLRLDCRLLGFEGDPRSSTGQKRLWAFAESLLPAPVAGHATGVGDATGVGAGQTSGAGLLNQALMELGALVCTPTAPACPECPVKTACAAFATNRQESIPQLAKRPEITELTEACVAVGHDGRFLLRRIPEGQRWAGLWDFPRVPVDAALLVERTAALTAKAATAKARQRQPGLFASDAFDRDAAASPASAAKMTAASTTRSSRRSALTGPLSAPAALAIASAVEAQTGQPVRVEQWLTTLRHSVTRYRIQLLCLRASPVETTAAETVFAETVFAETVIAESESLRWVALERLAEFPLSVTGRQLAERLAEAR